MTPYIILTLLTFFIATTAISFKIISGGNK